MSARSIKPLIVLSLLAVVLYDYPARAQSACAETQGFVEYSTYRSAILGRDMSYAIYTPPCYAAQENQSRRYPAVYLMHGSDAVDSTYWLRLNLTPSLDAGINAGTLPPMIVVLPFGDWIANQNQFGKVSWGNIFLTELLPAVESAYRIDARREGRAIGGISRGGFWAFHIAMLHPDLFSAVGGHSAFFHPDHLRTANPLFLAQSAPGIETLRIWLDHGKNDYAGPNIDLFHRRLEQRGVLHTYIVYPEGRHERGYWASHVPEYLLFYAVGWQDRYTPPPTPTVQPGGTPAVRDNVQPARYAEAAIGFVPVVAYRSLRATISQDELSAIMVGAGGENSNFVVDRPTAQALGLLDKPYQIVEPDELLPLLERNRRLFSLRAVTELTPRYRVLLIDEANPFYGTKDGLFSGPISAEGLDFDRLTTFMFSGVTAIVRDTADAFDQNGVAWAAGGLRGITRRADFYHMSNEVSFYETCPRFLENNGRPFGPFCAKDAHFDVFRELGADVIELSGNHNNDYGHAAYLRTLDMYHEAGIRTVGGGVTLAEARQPLLFEHHGNRIALLSCNWAGPKLALATETTPGAAFCEAEWLEAEIPRLRAANDVVIVTVQYREYDSFVPGPQQRADFRRLADLGADVVIGTQAHVPQTFEFYQTTRGTEAYIHYGLGNLYFDQTYFQMRSFLPEIYIYEGRLISVGLNVAIIDDYGRPRPMDAHNRDHFLGFMFQR